MVYTPEYRVWVSMKQRCYLETTVGFLSYGGRGISVCPEWRNSFATFIKDMGRRPSSKHSIERRDVDGDYCPENCYWATSTEQARNTRSNRILTFNGESKPVAQWAEDIGIPKNTLYRRLYRGWPIEKVLTVPYQQNSFSKGSNRMPKLF